MQQRFMIISQRRVLAMDSVVHIYDANPTTSV